MPLRPFSRDQAWLLPPTLDQLLPDDHPARFVAAFVEALDARAWRDLGVEPAGDPEGAPAYDPRALLSVWLYGFMTGVRSSRKLEVACRDQIPYLWLTGWQHPDHNTLWRFYRGHRQAMRSLFVGTVRTAVRVGLVDLAVQAVDGTRVGGNAALARTYDAAGLRKLLARTQEAIADLEAQNEAGDDQTPPRLPPGLQEAQALHERVQEALGELERDEGVTRINLTDSDAQLQRTRHGVLPGYNTQVVVSPLNAEAAGHTGMLLTAVEVVADPSDRHQLLPLLEQAEATTGTRATLTLADAGYHSGANLAACAEREQQVVMPEARAHGDATYQKDQFDYDLDTDTFRCPQGQLLSFRSYKRHRTGPPVRQYRAPGRVCRACPAFGVCTKSSWGRTIEVMPFDAVLRAHRRWMASDLARSRYRRRQGLVEPVFGILKEQLGLRRFLLRGIEGVRAEAALLATAFNLRTLHRVWLGWRQPFGAAA
jgi:transposase